MVTWTIHIQHGTNTTTKDSRQRNWPERRGSVALLRCYPLEARVNLTLDNSQGWKVTPAFAAGYGD